MLVGRPCLESLFCNSETSCMLVLLSDECAEPLAGCSLAAVLYALIKVGSLC